MESNKLIVKAFEMTFSVKPKSIKSIQELEENEFLDFIDNLLHIAKNK